MQPFVTKPSLGRPAPPPLPLALLASKDVAPLVNVNEDEQWSSLHAVRDLHPRAELIHTQHNHPAQASIVLAAMCRLSVSGGLCF